MKRLIAVAFTLGVSMSVLGCNPKVGLVVLDTNPQGATVYVNDMKVGDTPVTFEFDMDKPGTLRILKEGYQPKLEYLNASWVKSEYHQGHYGKGDYLIKGAMQKGYEIRTLRDLIRLEGK